MPGADVSAQPQFSLHSITVIQRLPVIRFLLTRQGNKKNPYS